MKKLIFLFLLIAGFCFEAQTIQLIDSYTKENVNFEKMSALPVGAKVDGIMIAAKNGSYYKRVYTSVNVAWFGALGTDNNNDTAGFQKAVDFLGSVGGGTLYIPKGKYFISNLDFIGAKYSNISIQGNGSEIVQIYGNSKTLEGYPHPTYARYPAADGVFNFESLGNDDVNDDLSIKNIEIQNLTFRSDVVLKKFDELNHQIAMHGVSGVKIANCKFIGFLGDGIAVSRGTGSRGTNAYNKNILIENCQFDGVNKDNRQGVSIYYADGFEIRFCDFKNITRSDMPGAIDIESDGNKNRSQRGLIYGCTFENIGGLGAVAIIQKDYFDQGKISYSGYVIENCDFRNLVTPLAVIGSLPFSKKSNYGIVFKDNRAENVETVADLRSAYGVKFDNNYFKNVTSSVNAIVRGGGVEKLLFENNSFENFANSEGLSFNGNSKGIDFINNSFQGFKKSIFYFSNPEAIGKIQGNKIGSRSQSGVIMLLPLFEDPLRLKAALIENNEVENGEFLIYDFLLSGNSPTTDNLLPGKLLLGSSKTRVTGTFPAGFSGAFGFVDNIRITQDLTAAPVCYQILYANSNNSGKLWKRQALTPTQWSAWSQY